MDKFSKVLLTIDNAHTAPQRALDCRLRLVNLTDLWAQPSHSLCLEYLHVPSISTSLPDVQRGINDKY